jgi:hypothetical protein
MVLEISSGLRGGVGASPEEAAAPAPAARKPAPMQAVQIAAVLPGTRNLQTSLKTTTIGLNSMIEKKT